MAVEVFAPRNQRTFLWNKWASLPGKGGKLLPKANRITVTLGEPGYFGRDMCESPPSRAGPSLTGSRETPGQLQLPLEQGAQVCRHKPLQGDTITQTCVARIGQEWERPTVPSLEPLASVPSSVPEEDNLGRRGLVLTLRELGIYPGEQIPQKGPGQDGVSWWRGRSI